MKKNQQQGESTASESVSRAALSHASSLNGKHAVLCITGGIAAYKAAFLTRALVKAGARVIVVMSEAAQQFITPLTLETLSGNPVVTQTFEKVLEMGAVEHIDLSEWADLVVVAPATYNFIGKLSAGIADDCVSTFMSAVTCPVFIAPAMNEHMWLNPINQRNIKQLKDFGFNFIDPERGGLACSWEGDGRMREPEEILADINESLSGITQQLPVNDSQQQSALRGQTILITAAGTHEAIDPVRFIGNRSSGRMGFALAESCIKRGAKVQLLAGPTSLPVPEGLDRYQNVESAEQMCSAAMDWVQSADIVIMAAAVADYRPAESASKKKKRGSGSYSLELKPTVDILKTLKKSPGNRFFVGFALETEHPEIEAQRKLQDKKLDLIVANTVSAKTGPDTKTNQVWIYDAQGLVQETPVLDKEEIAEIIVDVVVKMLQRRHVEV